MNTFTHQANLHKKDSKDIYNITKDFYFKTNAVIFYFVKKILTKLLQTTIF